MYMFVNIQVREVSRKHLTQIVGHYSTGNTLSRGSAEILSTLEYVLFETYQEFFILA